MSFTYLKPLIPLDLNKVYFIMLHHVDAKFATAEDIDKWHKERGWNGPGYNEYIRKDGTLIIMRGDNIGAHCEGMNSKSYGIALEGDYDIEPNMPEAQFNKLIERLQYHKKRFPNKIEVCKHSKFVDTNCPGVFFPFKRVLEYLDDELVNSINILMKNQVINSPDYWLKNAVKGGSISGENARFLIIKFANKLK